MVPAPENPRRSFVAAVRSNSRPPAYGPRSTTGTRTVRPPWRSVTFLPHGSVLFATPSVRGVSVPPQPRCPPYRPGAVPRDLRAAVDVQPPHVLAGGAGADAHRGAAGLARLEAEGEPAARGRADAVDRGRRAGAQDRLRH